MQPAFLYSSYLQQQDEIEAIRGRLAQYLILAIGFIVLFVQLFVSVKITLLLGLCIVITCLELGGFVWMVDLITMTSNPVEMNAIYVVNALACVGLTV